MICAVALLSFEADCPSGESTPLAACSVCAPEHQITESRAPILAQLRQCALARKKKYACKGMAVTSEYFRANLGLLDSDAAGMLDPWCQRTYEQHFIGRCPSGEYVLTASCRQPKSRKSILMAIRTAFSNSGHPLSTLRGDGSRTTTTRSFWSYGKN